MQTQQTQNGFPGPKSYRDFWETGSRITDSTSKNYPDRGFLKQKFPDSGIWITLHGSYLTSKLFSLIGVLKDTITPSPLLPLPLIMPACQLQNRLQNSRFFFLKIGPQSHSPFSASFHTFCLTARDYLNTQKYGLFCSLIPKVQTRNTGKTFSLRLQQHKHKKTMQWILSNTVSFAYWLRIWQFLICFIIYPQLAAPHRKKRPFTPTNPTSSKTKEHSDHEMWCNTHWKHYIPTNFWRICI